MKLAEALLLRADIQKRIESLRARIIKNTIVQEGEPPSENPETLLIEASEAIDQLNTLLFSINSANLAGKTQKDRTLTEAIADRETLILKHSLVRATAESAVKPAAYGTREIRWVSTIDVAELQKEADSLAEKIRIVNIEIQEANWKIDIS